MINSGVYRIYNAISDKSYIGQAQDFDDRKYDHFWMLRNNRHYNKHFQYAFNKYGEENFFFQPLECVEDLALLDDREQWWIDQYDFDKELYNDCPIAGSRRGCKDSEETRRKKSSICIGENNPFYGMAHSEETKQKIRAKKCGKTLTEEHKQKINPRGRTCSEETRQKMSIAHRGLIRTDEHNRNLAKAKMKPVRQIDLQTGEVIQIFESLGTAASSVGKTKSSIWATLRGKTQTCGGFIWEYC